MNLPIRTLISQHLGSSRSAWSIGVRGAIAEFLRSDEELTDPCDLEQLEVRTPRGALRISLPEDAVRRVRYRNSVHFCLPRSRASLPVCNEVVTELGADKESITSDFTQHVLFDLGLGIPHVQVCVRTAQRSVLSSLREAGGNPLLGSDRSLVHVLAAASPQRVFISRLARIEVYGPIPAEHTPDGPHTHLLPHLLGSSDEALDELISPAYQACLSLYFPD